MAFMCARIGTRAGESGLAWNLPALAGPETLQLSSPAFAEKVIPRVPIRRWGAPADFGGVAVYLASDASRYHTGDSFVIDGGYSIF